MRIVNGTVFADGMFEQREVHAVDGRFAETGGEADGVVVEAQGCYVIPGLVDVHFHGCVGPRLLRRHGRGVRGYRAL